ncbi:MAG: multicomponent Na+:H+ antiporter subunit D [Myxococcota bacterium]|jgi:multicomponent Na+:H+ antiporter subunit D
MITSLINSLPPGAIMMIGALLLPLLPRNVQGWGAVLLPVLSAIHLALLPGDLIVTLPYFGETLTPVAVDRLSLLFGYVFHSAAFLSALYAVHVRDPVQHFAGQLYAGAAIAAAFAGDLVTLFVYWELTAISSVFLLWASRDEGAVRAGLRYLIIQVSSGVILLAGVILRYQSTGDLGFREVGFLSFDSFDELTLPTALILFAFGIKAAFPFLHNWLQDSYPRATATGTVFLSAFTTKLAIYALARGFAGTDVLIPIGCVMTVFPIFFAVIENDLRKVLAYSLNNQLGFMVVAIGVADFATHPEIAQLALNGAAAHAFAHIIYKGLLFMAMGAVLYRVGTTKASELGGLYKSMPYTTVFCIIGALSISAFPLFSGFTTKSLSVYAVAEAHLVIPSLVLLFASAGVMEHSGIKIPFFAFFAHDSGKRVKEAPWNMLLAMGIAATLCIMLGVYPQPLYDILPFPMTNTGEHYTIVGTHVEYQNYSLTHVVTQLQLLMFAVLAFGMLMRMGAYPAEKRSVVLDFDWFYRSLIPRMIASLRDLAYEIADLVMPEVGEWLARRRLQLFHQFNERTGRFGQTQPTGTSAIWAALLLCAFLVLYYFG